MCRVLLSFALVAAVSCTVYRRNVDGVVESVAQDNDFDPTIRDWTSKCNDLAQFSASQYCTVFEFCCSHDPLNGDKCQSADKVCVYDNELGRVQDYKCILSNCTEMVTTTPPPTTTTAATGKLTSSSSRFYSVVASFFSLWLLLV